MIDRIFIFFVKDTTARWRAILLAWAVGSITGVLLALTSASTSELVMVCSGTSLIVFSISVVRYVLPEHERQPGPTFVQPRRAFVQYAYAACVAALLALVERLAATPTAVHAATLVAVKDVQDNRPTSDAQLISVKERIGTVLSNVKTSAATRKLLVSDYALAKAMQSAATTLKMEKKSYPKPEPSSKFTFEPPTPGVAFDVAQRNTFANLTLQTNSKDNRLTACDTCGTVFISTVIRGFSQKLDGITWIDVRFEDCSIEYDGGPLTLANVSFVNCSFSLLGSVAKSIRPYLESKAPIAVSSEYPS